MKRNLSGLEGFDKQGRFDGIRDTANVTDERCGSFSCRPESLTRVMLVIRVDSWRQAGNLKPETIRKIFALKF